jgi:hypothetical protein
MAKAYVSGAATAIDRFDDQDDLVDPQAASDIPAYDR